jgi:hypothetical protein
MPDLVDAQQAERLLHELAVELRRLPYHGHTRGMHLRALALKRAVVRWVADATCTEEDRRAIGEEIERLRHELSRGWARGVLVA